MISITIISRSTSHHIASYIIFRHVLPLLSYPALEYFIACYVTLLYRFVKYNLKLKLVWLGSSTFSCADGLFGDHEIAS